MKLTLGLASVLMMTVLVAQQSLKSESGLPDLHTINTAILSPSYSCRSSEEFQGGYKSTALFLSKYSKNRNSPDLLFNGACGSPDYFEGATAGDDMSLIADLGKMPIEQVSAAKSFNVKDITSFNVNSKFARVARVRAKHTYAVLISKRWLRGLFVFSVRRYVHNKQVDLQFAVKEYQVLDVREQSAGFNWESENAPISVPK